MEDMMDTAEGLIAACAQGVARTCERELEWLVTRQSQTAPDARDSLPSPPLPQLISALAAGGMGGAAGYARVTYSDAIKALSQVRQQLLVELITRCWHDAVCLHLFRSPLVRLKLHQNGASRCVLSMSV